MDGDGTNIPWYLFFSSSYRREPKINAEEIIINRQQGEGEEACVVFPSDPDDDDGQSRSAVDW